MARVVLCLTVLAMPAAPLAAQGVPGTDRAVNFGASRITIDVTDAPLPEVAKLFAQQSGNLPFNIHKQFRKRTVTLSLKDVPYWQAVDRLCETAGLYCGRRRGPKGELQLQDAVGPEDGRAYAGPALLKVWHIRRRHIYRPAPVLKLLTSGHYAMIQVFWRWEDRLPVADSELWLTALVTPDGTNLIDSYATKGPRRVTYGQIYVGLRPEGADRLASIEGYLLFEFAEGKRELKIDDVQGDKPAASDDRMGLEVLKSWWIDDSLVTTLRLSVKGAATWPPLRPRRGPYTATYGFFLQARDGKRYPAIPTTSVPKLAEKLKRLQKRKAAPTSTPSEFEISFRFYKLPQDVKLWSLVWVYPESHEFRKYPFEMKDVPLR